MNLTKNIRISLYILVPILLWMISGFFKNDSIQEPIQSSELFNVQTVLSIAEEYQPYIKLKATTKSEKELMKSKNIRRSSKNRCCSRTICSKRYCLCSLGVVELNRTEVKAPFSGYIEQIVKPGNFLKEVRCVQQLYN